MEQLIAFRHWWIVFIAVTCANGLLFWSWLKANLEQPTAARVISKTLVSRFLFWANLPWVVMGIGIVFGNIPTVFHYFRPQDGNPYVIAWYASGLFVWIVGFYWLFMRGGAETVAQNCYGTKSKSGSVKVVYLVYAAVMLLGIVIIIAMDISIPTIANGEVRRGFGIRS